jgi:hypothetical protein
VYVSLSIYICVCWMGEEIQPEWGCFFLLECHMFEFRGGKEYVHIHRPSSQIVAWRGSLVPQTRGLHMPFWLEGGKSMYIFIDQVVKLLHGGGPLSHKQGVIICHFGIYLGHALKKTIIIIIIISN